MAKCNQCGAEITDVNFCPNCGAPLVEQDHEKAPHPDPHAANNSNVDQNLIAALSYLVITAVIFLLVEPYKHNRFVRFHCFQAIFYWLATLVVWVAFGIVGSMFGFLAIAITPLVALGLFVVWIILLVKAFQGEMFKLPVIGDLAEQQVTRPS